MELLTNSRMQSFKACRRRHWLGYEKRIRKVKTAGALNFGSAFHLGLDVYAKSTETDPNQRSNAAISTVYLAAYSNRPAWCVTDEQFAAWQLEGCIVANLLAGYFWYWGGQPEQKDETLATELQFSIPLVNPETGHSTPNWELAGCIDKIISRDGRVLLREHKTTGLPIDDEDYWAALLLDEQISLYFIAAQRLGYDVQGVDYDVIHKPGIRPKQIPNLDGQGRKIVVDANGERVFKKDGQPRESGDTAKGYVLSQHTETLQEYGKRLREEIAADPAKYFRRREIARVDGDLEAFKGELWEIQLAVRECQKTGRNYRTARACKNPYPCEYRPLCLARFDPDKDQLPEGFVVLDTQHPELEKEPADE